LKGVKREVLTAYGGYRAGNIAGGPCFAKGEREGVTPSLAKTRNSLNSGAGQGKKLKRQKKRNKKRNNIPLGGNATISGTFPLEGGTPGVGRDRVYVKKRRVWVQQRGKE